MVSNDTLDRDDSTVVDTHTSDAFPSTARENSMSLQQEQVVMIGRGIENHGQPHQQFPRVPDGNHLRWSFDPAVGFARHGYYLFRREHIGDRVNPTQLDSHVAGSSGQTRFQSITTPRGTVQLRSKRAQSFVSSGNLAVDVDPGPVRVTFSEPVFEATVDLTVRQSVEVRAVAGDITLDTMELDANGSATFEFDRIEALVLEGGQATITDVAFYPVSVRYAQDWKPIDGFDGPLGLPLFHPDYPATGGGAQDLPTARQTADDRILYGDSSHYTSPADTHDSGTVDVQSGSIIVTANSGSDTNWSSDLVGRTFQAAGDRTAYVVTEVRPAERGPDELLLSRPYEGGDRRGLSYTLTDDEFGQLHDYLVHLVDGNRSEGGMLGRVIPGPLESNGDVLVRNDSKWVYTWNTTWKDHLEGLYFQAAVDEDGTVSVGDGDPTVRRDTGSVPNPAWPSHVEGLAIRFGDQRSVYTITNVDTGTPNTLELDRAYAGPPLANASFTIYEPDRYRIESVDSTGNYLELARPYRGSLRVTDYLVTGAFGEQGQEATSSWQAPLELTLLGSIDPAIAQALGLYWLDRTAEKTTSYDYLLLADHDGLVARHLEGREVVDPAELELIGHPTVDGYITFDVQRGTARAVDAPSGAEAYALPPSPPEEHTTDEGSRYGTNTAGISWESNPGARGAILPDDPVQYHLWRHDFDGERRPSSVPPVDQYEPLTAPSVAETDRDEPILVGASSPTDLAGWPDHPIHAVDRGVLDGWYSYRISGVDLFGRASDLGNPADWVEDGITRHQSAIHLVDRHAPPPPRQVDAEVLDVDQPAAGTGEARVSWIWPDEFQQQAPDAVEFEVQYHPGKLNDQIGEITGVNEPYDDIYEVETDIEALDPADGYEGATLHVGGAIYEVEESSAAADGTLTLEVIDTRPEPRKQLETDRGKKTVRVSDSRPNVTKGVEKAEQTLEEATRRDPPAVGRTCTVSVPPAYRKGTVIVTDGNRTVTGYDTNWSDALAGQEFTTPDGNSYTIASVPDDDELELESPYEIPDPDTSERTRFDYAIEHPVRIDYSQPTAWADPTEPANWASTHATVSVDDYDEVVSAGDPDNPLDTGYRVYETTVPIPKVGDPPSDPFATGESEPITYAHVGVNTHDRQGNAGEVSAPVTLTRVFEGTPEPPTQPSFESSIDYATAPDYDGESKYTVRFVQPGDNRRVHVYRAMDKAVFRADWERRKAGNATRSLEPTKTELFPPYRRDSATAERREGIRDEIESLHDAVTSESNFEDALPHYRDLEPDVLQTLAGLDGTESAYTQRTMDALDPDEHPNIKGPDFESGDPGPNYQPGPDAPDAAVPGSELCAWVDSFDGKSRRRYFYRTGTVNEAGTRSDGLSYPTRPVQAVDTVPPSAPTVTKVTAGHTDPGESDHGVITLRWSRNPERDVASYSVYRALSREDAADIRLMTEVASVPNPDADEVVWTDETPPPLERSYYRLVAVDENGNVSRASDRYAARATEAPPTPPTPTVSWEADGNGGHRAAVSWTSDYETMVQLKPVDATNWISRSDWLSPGSQTFQDEAPDASDRYDLRLLARSTTGATGAGNAATLTELSNQ